MSADTLWIALGAAPGKLHGVAGDGGRVGFGDGDELAAQEPADGGLRGAAREAGVFGELLVAEVDGCFAAGLLASKPEVDEERCGFAVVAGEVAEEGVEDVVVQLNLLDLGGHSCTDHEYSDEWAIVVGLLCGYGFGRRI